MVSTAVREVAEKRSAGSTPVMLLFPRWRLVTRYLPPATGDHTTPCQLEGGR